MKVVKEEPPRLNAKRNFSKQFREVVEACLVKSPSERLSC